MVLVHVVYGCTIFSVQTNCTTMKQLRLFNDRLKEKYLREYLKGKTLREVAEKFGENCEASVYNVIHDDVRYSEELIRRKIANHDNVCRQCLNHFWGEKNTAFCGKDCRRVFSTNRARRLLRQKKVCNKCAAEKTAKEFYTFPGRYERRLDSFCKKCRNVSSVDWIRRNMTPERREARYQAVLKYLRKNREVLLAKIKWRRKNEPGFKEKEHARWRKSYYANRERILQRKRDSRKNSSKS